MTSIVASCRAWLSRVMFRPAMPSPAPSRLATPSQAPPRRAVLPPAVEVTVPVSVTSGGGLASPQFLQSLQSVVQEAILRYVQLNQGYDPYVVCGVCGSSYPRGQSCTNKDCPTNQGGKR
jgi:hypothetical protein